MAINPSRVDTSIQTPQVQVTPDMAALRGVLAGTQIGGEQALQAQKQKAGMDLVNAAGGLKALLQGGHSVDVGGNTIGSGLGAVKGGGAEQSALGKDYQTHLQPYTDQANTLLSGAKALKSGTVQGDELQAIMKARSAEGKGARLLGSVADAFNVKGNPSAPGFLQEVSNKISGSSISAMTPAQRKALADIYSGQLDSVDQQADKVYKTWRASAPGKMPITTAMGQTEGTLANYPHPTRDITSQARQMLDDVRQGKLDNPAGISTPASEATSGVMGALGGGFKSVLGSLMGGKTGSAPAAPATGKIRVRDKTSGQTGTLDASEFDASKYDKL